MACSTEFIDSVSEILSPLGEVRSRKMMGDYVIYLNDKCVATACDNLLYVKMLPCVDELMLDSEIGKPYDGAKDHYILDLSNEVFVRKVISALWEEIPFPRKGNDRIRR